MAGYANHVLLSPTALRPPPGWAALACLVLLLLWLAAAALARLSWQALSAWVLRAGSGESVGTPQNVLIVVLRSGLTQEVQATLPQWNVTLNVVFKIS